MTELILGTAQFGHGYGITNRSGRIGDVAVTEILEVALAGGIEIFDTADAYGDAQTRLGRLLPRGAERRFVSKFAIKGQPAAESMFGDACARLGTESLYGLLFHQVSDLLDSRFNAALARIREAVSAGTIGKFGVSVYDQDDLELAMRLIPDMTLVQIPGSIVDRRLLDSRSIEELRNRGVEVHVRSVFLQGLLLATDLPDRFDSLRPIVRGLDHLAARQGVTRMQILLEFLRSHENADAIVVGATSRGELAQVVEAWNEPVEILDSIAPGRLPVDTIDPRKWG